MCYFSIYISNATFSASGGFNNTDNILTLPYTATGLRSRTSTMFQYSGGNFTTNVGGDINPGGNHCYLYKEQIPYAHSAWNNTTSSGTYWIISGSYQVGKTAGPL